MSILYAFCVSLTLLFLVKLLRNKPSGDNAFFLAGSFFVTYTLIASVSYPSLYPSSILNDLSEVKPLLDTAVMILAFNILWLTVFVTHKLSYAKNHNGRRN